MKVKLWINIILAYLSWLIALLLGFWFGIIGTEAFRAFLGTLSTTSEKFEFQKQLVLADRVFSVLIWLVWLVMMVVTEEAFRRAAQKGGLLKRFAYYIGPLLLLVFVADVYLLSVAGFSSAGPLRWLLMALELLLGIALTLYGWSAKKTRRANTGQMPAAQGTQDDQE